MQVFVTSIDALLPACTATYMYMCIMHATVVTKNVTILGYNQDVNTITFWLQPCYNCMQQMWRHPVVL